MDTVLSRRHPTEPALVYERSNKAEYKFTSVPVPKMTPGKRYLIGVYVKTVDMKHTRGGATVAIEYGDSKRKYAGGVWPEGLTDAKEWTKVEAYVSLTDDAKHVTMLLYMRQGATGKAYFSRPYVSLVEHSIWESSVFMAPLLS